MKTLVSFHMQFHSILTQTNVNNVDLILVTQVEYLGPLGSGAV